jgi:uncharacterized protein YdaU (DUF1376 family)
MAQYPCLPLWTDAWKADTDHLTAEQRGCYLDLLILMWRSPHCRVPNDFAWICRHLPSDPANILKMLIDDFCITNGNFIIQKRLQREFVSRTQYSERMSDLRKRRKNNKKDVNTERTTRPVASPSLPQALRERTIPFQGNGSLSQEYEAQAPPASARASVEPTRAPPDGFPKNPNRQFQHITRKDFEPGTDISKALVAAYSTAEQIRTTAQINLIKRYKELTDEQRNIA